MNVKRNAILAAAAVAVAALVATGCDSCRPSPEKRADWAVKKISSKLDLTKEQKAKLDAAIAEIIVKMAQTLKLSVMAEGVETKAQMDFLSFHGCHEMQGYYFSRPVTADEITSLLGSENQLS